MAKKPKDAAEMTADDAKNVIEAAKRFTAKLRDFKDAEKSQNTAMDATKAEVDSMDKQFQGEDITVRVLQIGPDGKLTDVSEKVNPKDLRPEQIAEMRSDTLSIPMGKDGKIDREAAKELLAQIMGSGSYRPSQGTSPTTSIAMSKMEAALAESDKIIKHFKE
jgi:hypothetical protein